MALEFRPYGPSMTVAASCGSISRDGWVIDRLYSGRYCVLVQGDARLHWLGPDGNECDGYDSLMPDQEAAETALALWKLKQAG